MILLMILIRGDITILILIRNIEILKVILNLVRTPFQRVVRGLLHRNHVTILIQLITIIKIILVMVLI